MRVVITTYSRTEREVAPYAGEVFTTPAYEAKGEVSVTALPTPIGFIQIGDNLIVSARELRTAVEALR